MAFPITINGVVKVPYAAEQSVSEYISTVSTRLETERAKDITVTGNRIAFRGGMFRSWFKRNFLDAIDSGEIEIFQFPTEVQVTYKLSFLHSLGFSTFSLLAFIFATRHIWFTGIEIFFLLSIWLYNNGINIYSGVRGIKRIILSFQATNTAAASEKKPEKVSDIPDIDEERASL